MVFHAKFGLAQAQDFARGKLKRRWIILLGSAALVPYAAVQGHGNFRTDSGTFPTRYAAWWQAHKSNNTQCQACHVSSAPDATPFDTTTNKFGDAVLAQEIASGVVDNGVSDANANYAGLEGPSDDADGDNVSNLNELKQVSGFAFVASFPGDANSVPPPVISQVQSYSTPSNQALQFTDAEILKNVSDPFGTRSLTVKSVTSGTGGTVSSSAVGSYQFQPQSGYTGPATIAITVEAANPSGAPPAASGILNITVQAALPTPTISISPLLPNNVIFDDTDLSSGKDVGNIQISQGGSNPVPTLSGPDAGLFEIVGIPGQYVLRLAALNPATVLNAATKPSLSVNVNLSANGLTAPPATFTLTVAPPIPVANNDTATVSFNTPVTINVTANDVAKQGISSVAVGSKPAHGAAVLASNGRDIVYTPNTGYTGPDSFTYTITSGTQTSAAATVSITVPQFTAGLIGGATQDPRLKSVAQTLDNTCVALDNPAPNTVLTSNQTQLRNICYALEADVKKGQGIDPALNAISPEEAFAASDSSFDVWRTVSSNVSGRLDKLRRREGTGGGVDVASLNFASANPLMARMQRVALNGLASGVNKLMMRDGEVSQQRWGFFVAGDIDFGRRTSKSAGGKRSFDTYGITSGIDYQFSDVITAGMALSYSKLSSDFSGVASKLDVESLTVTGYGSASLGAVIIDGQLGLAQHSFDSSREIKFITNGISIDELATASYKGHDFSASARATVPIIVGPISIDAQGGVNYISAFVSGYTESGGNGLSLFLKPEKETYFIGDLGVNSRLKLGSKENPISPYLSFKYHILTGRNDRRIIAGFVADPLQRASIVLRSQSDDDNNFMSVNAGVDGMSFGRLEWGLGYSTIFGLSNYRSNQVTVLLALPF